MAATHFSGPVVSAAGYQGPTLATSPGAGITGVTTASVTTQVNKMGFTVQTHIFLDIEGLASSATNGDIIGKDGTGAAYFARVLNAESGEIYSGTISCLEAPTTGDPDIDFHYATEATGVEDAAISSLTQAAMVTTGASWTVGLTKPLTGWPSNGKYLYMAVGNTGVAGTYASGKFLIELLGYSARNDV